MTDLSQRPYLVRAMHEWMSDAGYTPHIVVDASLPGVQVPAQHVENGRIVLNVSYSAAHNLNLDNDSVSFGARFAGTPCEVCVPVEAILGIYARETGQGMVFGEPGNVDRAPETKTSEDSQAGRDAPGRPDLRVVK